MVSLCSLDLDGGCYQSDHVELKAFPFGYRELEPYYARMAKRIG